MDVYVKQIANSANHDLFYTNAAVQTAFKNYIKTFVGRYVNEPTIMAWELANEPRCKGSTGYDKIHPSQNLTLKTTLEPGQAPAPPLQLPLGQRVSLPTSSRLIPTISSASVTKVFITSPVPLPTHTSTLSF